MPSPLRLCVRRSPATGVSGAATLVTLRLPSEVDELHKDMLINVSHMFRDESTLELLKSKVLPILATKRTTEQPIRIWVAGCASGEEAYSLAIICREFSDR